MLDQRRRRWANIETALDECPVLFGLLSQTLAPTTPTMANVR